MTTKEAYLKKAHAKLDEWNADLDKMKAKLSAADADAKVKLNDTVKKLETQRDEMKQKLVELERADDELVEITPKTIRIRKRYLLEHERKRASRAAA